MWATCAPCNVRCVTGPTIESTTWTDTWTRVSIGGPIPETLLTSSDRNERSFRCDECPAAFNRRFVFHASALPPHSCTSHDTRVGTTRESVRRLIREFATDFGATEICSSGIRQIIPRLLQKEISTMVDQLKGPLERATPV